MAAVAGDDRGMLIACCSVRRCCGGRRPALVTMGVVFGFGFSVAYSPAGRGLRAATRFGFGGRESDFRLRRNIRD